MDSSFDCKTLFPVLPIVIVMNLQDLKLGYKSLIIFCNFCMNKMFQEFQTYSCLYNWPPPQLAEFTGEQAQKNATRTFAKTHKQGGENFISSQFSVKYKFVYFMFSSPLKMLYQNLNFRFAYRFFWNCQENKIWVIKLK